MSERIKTRRNLEMLLARLGAPKSATCGTNLSSSEAELCKKAILAQLQIQDMLEFLTENSMNKEHDLYKLLDSLSITDTSGI